MSSYTSSLIIKLTDQVSAPARAASATLGRLQAAQQRNSAALAATQSKMLGAVGAGYALYKALSLPTTAAIAFEASLEDIAQKIDVPISQLQDLGKEVRAVARATTLSAQEAAAGIDVLAGMGANRADSMALMGPIGRAATAYKAEVSDLAQAGYAALDNLKVPAEQFGAALDAMAQAGKAGAFELKDMAKYFPALGAGYQALGQTGVPAVADLSAALQIVRKGTGDSASAATNLSNILQKMQAPQTVKAFKKMGVNLTKELKVAAEKGMTPIEAIAEITSRTLKGDMSKLGYLFSDAQVQQGLRPLLQNMEEYRKIRKEAFKAQGVVEEDYQRRLKTGAVAAKRFSLAFESISLSIGNVLMPVLADLAESLVPILNSIADFTEANPKLTKTIILLTTAFVGLRVAIIAAKFSMLWLGGGFISSAVAGVGLLGRSIMFIAGLFRYLRVALLLVTVPFGAIVSFISSIGTAGAAIGAVLAGISAPVWGIIALCVAAVAAIVAIGYYVYKNFEQVKAKFIEITSWMYEGGKNIMSSLWDGMKSIMGDIANWLKTSISNAASSAVSSIRNMLPSWMGGTTPHSPTTLSAPVSAAIDGARAKGGMVTRGGSYLVGELGPELFTPSQSGFIHNAQNTAGHLNGLINMRMPSIGNSSTSPGLGNQSKQASVNLGGVTINIQASQNMNVNELAKKVMQTLSNEVQSLGRGAFSDGGY